MEVTDFHKKKMPIEHARNLFKLSEAMLQKNPTGENLNSLSEAERLRGEADRYLARTLANVSTYDREDAFDKLMPIFWR